MEYVQKAVEKDLVRVRFVASACEGNEWCWLPVCLWRAHVATHLCRTSDRQPEPDRGVVAHLSHRCAYVPLLLGQAKIKAAIADAVCPNLGTVVLLTFPA